MFYNRTEAANTLFNLKFAIRSIKIVVELMFQITRFLSAQMGGVYSIREAISAGHHKNSSGNLRAKPPYCES